MITTIIGATRTSIALVFKKMTILLYAPSGYVRLYSSLRNKTESEIDLN